MGAGGDNGAISAAAVCAFTILVSHSAPAAAQQQSPSAPKVIDVAFAALASVQPTDRSFSNNGPYVSKPLGGVGPGLAAGLAVSSPGRVSVAAEFSTAFIRGSLQGRLDEPAGARLNDSLVSLLVGTARPGLNARGGVSWVGGPSTASGIGNYQGGHVALTAGLDGALPASARIAFLGTFRYSLVRRSDGHRYIGVGPHVLRAGVGIRVRLSP
jgi:hypothetical protein